MMCKYLLPFQLFSTVKRSGDKVALIINDQSFTYAEIYEDVINLAHYIKALPHKSDGRAILLSGNSYLTVVSFWALLICDLVPCIIDPDCNPAVLKKIIHDIEPEMCFYAQLTSAQNAIIYESSVLHIKNIPKKNFIHPNFEFTSKKTECDLAMIMHTSGSTGEPKGVMLSHRNVIAAIKSITAYLKLDANNTILSVLPLHFDYGLYQMLLSFAVGCTLVLENNLLFPQIIAQKIINYRVTVLPCVPIMVQLFYLSAQRHQFDFSSVRMVTNTGENLSARHIAKIKSLFPAAKIFSMFGLTECKRCSYVPPEMLDSKFESIGIPMPNLKMWVADHLGNPLPANTEGELVISGPTVMMGYWNKPEATSKKIIVDQNGNRLLKSGDRVMMDNDGYFYFKGRGDGVLKYKGVKLNLVDLIKKINTITHINRSYLFINEINKKLIVCVEVEQRITKSDELRLLINAEFTSQQKPDHIFITNHFPSLSNGKLDVSTLEKIANEFFSESELV